MEMMACPVNPSDINIVQGIGLLHPLAQISFSLYLPLPPPIHLTLSVSPSHLLSLDLPLSSSPFPSSGPSLSSFPPCLPSPLSFLALFSAGVYPIKPALPGVGGGEGVGVVKGKGEGVTELKEGDWVIPAQAATGERGKERERAGDCGQGDRTE